MAFKFLPALQQRLFNPDTPTSHAIAGSVAALAGGGTQATVFSSYAGGDWDVERAVREGLERVMAVFRCVDAISSNQAGLKMILRQGDPDNGEEVADDDIFKLLNIRANNYENAWQFRYRMSAQALLSKRGVFVEVVRDAFGVPRELHLLPPQLVEPIPDPNTYTAGYWLQTARNGRVFIEDHRVIWLKLKPHPIDPYCQMTPLMSAGLAVDTDFLARWYNRNFLLNDGRPGLLINIQNLMGANDATEIRDRFSGGPRYAGRTTVLESDGITVQDLAASPRDMEWLQAVQGSKDDILLAFGTPVSVLGDASGRTFDNADAEKENWWDATEKPHCDSIGRGLDPLTNNVYDNTFIGYNYDTVDVLQRQKIARNQRKMAEFQAGLCTWDDYQEFVGRPRWDTPGTRSVFLTNGVILSQNAQDEEIVKNLPVIGVAQQQAGQMALQGGGQPMGISTVGGGSSRPALPAGPQQKSASQRARELVASKTENTWDDDDELEEKSAIAFAHDDTDIIDAEIVHPYEAFRAQLENTLGGVMEAWASDMSRIVPDRLEHVKSREGTRHWTNKDGSTIETKDVKRTLNPAYAVDTDRWSANLAEDMTRVMRRAGIQAMKDAATDMQDQGVLAVMHANGLGNVTGRSTLGLVYGNQQNAVTAVNGLLKPLQDIVTTAAQNHTARIAKKIHEMDMAGGSMTSIKSAVKQMAGKNSPWRNNLATFLTTSLYEGAQEETYKQAGVGVMEKKWVSHHDERVRATHVAVDGRVRPAEKKFRVGNSWLSRPCDPRGEIKETANCRCHLDWSIAPKFANKLARVQQTKTQQKQLVGAK